MVGSVLIGLWVVIRGQRRTPVQSTTSLSEYSRGILRERTRGRMDKVEDYEAATEYR